MLDVQRWESNSSELLFSTSAQACGWLSAQVHARTGGHREAVARKRVCRSHACAVLLSLRVSLHYGLTVSSTKSQEALHPASTAIEKPW